MSSEYTPTRSSGGGRSRRGGQRRSGGNRSGGPRSHPQSNIEAAAKPVVVPAKKSLIEKILSFFGSKPEKKVSYARKENNFGGAETRRSNGGGGRGERSERPERSERSSERPARTRSESSESTEPRAERPARAERAPRPTGFRTPEIVEVTSSRIYVGNLSFDATESDLQELFSGVGQVQNVEIVANKHTQRSKGFGFIQLGSIDEAKRAVTELHDKEFMSRKLVVSGAKAVEEKRSERNERQRSEAEAAAPEAEAHTEAVSEQEPHVADAQPEPEVRKPE
jgi:RNA recognition motif-containing protein